MSLSNYYKDKVVIITGGSMGIGKELAKQLLTFGAKVVITGRTLEKLQKVQTEFNASNDQMLVHAGDVSSIESNNMLVADSIEQFGKLDVLINNAGMSAFGELGEIKEQVVKQVVDTNIYGSVFPTMSAISELKKTKGSILFVSSIAGLTGLPAYSAYSLSKMSLRSLAHSLRIELSRFGVYVGICYVGFTENESSKRTLNPDGTEETVPGRPKMLTSTREKTAKKMLRQIKKRRYSVNQSVLGQLVMFMSKLLPGLAGWVMRMNYKPDHS
ncbi:MAG: SDR family NAD(P)-dependent oxidoreductase [Bacteroidia bacterium]